MNIIMSRTSCSVFLSLLVLSSFVAEIHGSNNKQVQALNNLHKSKFKTSSSSSQDVTHRSEFEVEELLNYDDVIDSQEGLKEKDRILKLPGQPQVKFSQYGGYVTVDKSNGRAFYYYFVEAQNSKDTLPLLLWLNGAANVLFLESPTGVGFSYSNTSSDYKTNGDKKTAADNYLFLVNWLERFPEYKNREFYISGESYAGHYVPQLAHTILYHNKRAKRTIINLKGILIGNAVINDDTDNKGMYDFLATHAIISDQTASDIEKFCDFSSSKTTSECDDAAYEADKNIYYIDLYNIYAPDCKNNNLTAYPKKPSIVTDPCSESYVHAYMNREDVQEALHANVTKLVYDWELCSNVIGRWGDSSTTVLPLLHEFLNNNLRVWIFSGDIDGRVPVTSTKYSIKKMNLPIKTKWHAWFAYGEVGGYTEVYKAGLTLATVRGAGHQVPSYQPARALSLIMHFLNGTPLPDTKRYQ
nr:serine carboxypeptidase-like 40 isoform X2 [Arachis hypogaea]